jgi:hypothetical protein
LSTYNEKRLASIGVDLTLIKNQEIILNDNEHICHIDIFKVGEWIKGMKIWINNG